LTLQANASASELVKSVDSAIDSAVSLDAGVMQGYTAVLAQTITDSKPSEIVITCIDLGISYVFL